MYSRLTVQIMRGSVTLLQKIFGISEPCIFAMTMSSALQGVAVPGVCVCGGGGPRCHGDGGCQKDGGRRLGCGVWAKTLLGRTQPK